MLIAHQLPKPRKVQVDLLFRARDAAPVRRDGTRAEDVREATGPDQDQRLPGVSSRTWQPRARRLSRGSAGLAEQLSGQGRPTTRRKLSAQDDATYLVRRLAQRDKIAVDAQRRAQMNDMTDQLNPAGINR
jgi:hypothetical protein